MEFDEDDLRPMTTASRPRTSLGHEASNLPTRPQTASSPRPMTSQYREGSARPKTGYRKAQSRIGTAVARDFQTDQSRPFSRAGSAVGDRPGSNLGRPMTSSTRLGSAMGNRGVPGTASRLLASAMQNRPASRTGIGLQTPINVADRPVTQQGLSGMRTGTAKGPQRQYQDKSYFMGQLRSKMSELQAEINKMNREIDLAKDEQSTYLDYDKRVKELAAELTESQGILADYNLLVDKLNTDTERAEVEQEAIELKAQNDVVSREVDSLFAEKQDREKMIIQMEHEIDQEGHMAENLVAAMQPELRDRYLELTRLNVQYQADLERMNQEVDALNSRKAALEDELSMSSVKKDALALFEQLREAEEKRDQLILEEKERGTPAQERERLLQQVKDDNAEISTMERQIAEQQDKLAQLQEEQGQLDQDLEENLSERNQKYRELRKREETMDHFLANFEDNKSQELERLTELEQEIQLKTEEMSRNLSHVGHLPTSQGYAGMRDDLAFKEGEMEKSKNTLEGLTREQGQLQMNLDKIEALEGKIVTEKNTIRDNMRKMEDELVVFTDLDKLKTEAEEKREILASQKTELADRKVAAEEMLKEMEDKSIALKKQLLENETHVQLSNLEKKLSHLEQNNFTIQEFIANKKAELNFEPVRNKVLKMQWDYNKLLVENVKNASGS